MSNEKLSIKEKVEKYWDDTWKDILMKPDGTIDVEQLKKELADFSEMIGRMITLTSRLTGGKLSYPTYDVDVIIEQMEEHNKETERENHLDMKECGLLTTAEKLDIAMKALKFYADPLSWREGDDQCHASQITSADTEPANGGLAISESDYVAGKTARDAIADIEEGSE